MPFRPWRQSRVPYSFAQMWLQFIIPPIPLVRRRNRTHELEIYTTNPISHPLQSFWWHLVLEVTTLEVPLRTSWLFHSGNVPKSPATFGIGTWKNMAVKLRWPRNMEDIGHHPAATQDHIYSNYSLPSLATDCQLFLYRVTQLWPNPLRL